MTNKQKYIALLTEGELEKEIIDALHRCGYVLKRESEYGGCITNHYVKNNPPEPLNKFKFTLIDSSNKTIHKKFSNFGNVCDVTCGMG